MKVKKKFIEQISHEDLSGVQGGRDGEHYHLTAADRARIDASVGNGSVIVATRHIERKTATSATVLMTQQFDIPGAEVGDPVIVGFIGAASNLATTFYLSANVSAPGVVKTQGYAYYQGENNSPYSTTARSLDLYVAVLKRPGGSDALYAQLDGMSSAALEAALADAAQVTAMRHILGDPVRAKAIMDDAARMQTVMESDTARGLALTTNTSLMAIAMSTPAREWMMGHNDIFQAARRTIYDTTIQMVSSAPSPWYRAASGVRTGSSKLSGYNSYWRPSTTSYGPGFVFFCFGVAQMGGASSEMCRVVHPDGSTAAEGNGGGLYQPSVMQSVDAVSFDNCTTVGAGTFGDVANNGSIYAEPTFIYKAYTCWAL